MTSIKKEKIALVLRSIKDQHIDISIKNKSGRWSKEYYMIEELKDIKHEQTALTLVVLRPGCFSCCVVADLNSIYGIKLNKYLNLDGHLIREL
jgi:hypothetical protein